MAEGEDLSKPDPTAKPGDLKFADINGDGRITPDDRMIFGQTTPKWYGGITNTFHYNGLSLKDFYTDGTRHDAQQHGL